MMKDIVCTSNIKPVPHYGISISAIYSCYSWSFLPFNVLGAIKMKNIEQLSGQQVKLFLFFLGLSGQQEKLFLFFLRLSGQQEKLFSFFLGLSGQQEKLFSFFLRLSGQQESQNYIYQRHPFFIN